MIVINDFVKKIVDFLGFEYELFNDIKDDVILIDKFNDYTIKGQKEGFVPIIIVASDILAEAFELALEDADLTSSAEDIACLRQQIIEKAQTVNVKEFLQEKLAEYNEMHKEDDIQGDFIYCQPSDCFYSYYDYNNKPMENIILAKIPVKNPWEVAAWLPMGGFNDCPTPAEQVAVFRFWYEKYGAVPAVVTYENWELELKKPPVNKKEALELAEEHFAFCYDRMMQGAKDRDNLKALASELVDSTTWYFWWD